MIRGKGVVFMADWLSSFREETQRIREETQRLREENEKLRKARRALRSLTPEEISNIVRRSIKKDILPDKAL
jgi:hypothetical protein